MLAYYEGMDSQLRGFTEADCPFPEGDEKHVLWLRGFRDSIEGNFLDLQGVFDLQQQVHKGVDIL